MHKNELTRERRALIILLMALLALFFWLMRPFWIPILLATIIVVLLYPFYNALNRRIKRPRLASLISTVCVFLLLILPSVLVTSVLINQTYAVIENLDLKATFSQLFSNRFYLEYIDPYLVQMERRFHINIDIFSILTQVGKEGAKYIYRFSPQVLIGTANFIFNFFIMLFGIYFLFLEGPRLLKLLFEISPLRDTHELRLSRQFKNMIEASIFGYLLTALVQGVLAAVAFGISGLNAFAVLGTLTFFMSMVPVIGAAGVWIPVCVWLFLSGHIGWGIFNLVYGAFIISGIDNVLKPLIIQGRTHIHPLLIFFSLFGGIILFGPLGIVFGPVITALFIATIKIYREEFVKS